MCVSGRRGSLEPTIDRKRQLYRKFVDYYSRSFGFARITFSKHPITNLAWEDLYVHSHSGHTNKGHLTSLHIGPVNRHAFTLVDDRDTHCRVISGMTRLKFLEDAYSVNSILGLTCASLYAIKSVQKSEGALSSNKIVEFKR